MQLEHPEQGIRFASPLSDSSVQLLRIGLRDATAPLSTPRVVDHYIRQKDLVVTYEYDQPQMRMQLYWRHATWRDSAGGSLTGLCLLLSLQTNRLDSRPTVTVATEIACEKVDCFDSAIQPMESNAVLGDPPMSV